MKRLQYKLVNFAKALQRLKEAIETLKRDRSLDIVRDGVIQRFEFTYELAWKTTKEYLEELGIVERTSPKSVIKEAYAQKLIANESAWLMMISDRNQTSHVYQEKLAEEIAARIEGNYLQEFEALLGKLQTSAE